MLSLLSPLSPFPLPPNLQKKLRSKTVMFSLKSIVLLALLASVSANRDLLQGEFLIYSVLFGFRECVADVSVRVGQWRPLVSFFAPVFRPIQRLRWIFVDFVLPSDQENGLEKLRRGDNCPVFDNRVRRRRHRRVSGK